MRIASSKGPMQNTVNTIKKIPVLANTLLNDKKLSRFPESAFSNISAVNNNFLKRFATGGREKKKRTVINSRGAKLRFLVTRSFSQG